MIIQNKRKLADHLYLHQPNQRRCKINRRYKIQKLWLLRLKNPIGHLKKLLKLHQLPRNRQRLKKNEARWPNPPHPEWMNSCGAPLFQIGPALCFPRQPMGSTNSIKAIIKGHLPRPTVIPPSKLKMMRAICLAQVAQIFLQL